MPENNTVPERELNDTAKSPHIRQWRVGTISMGLALVGLGVVLLIGKLSLSARLRFWPLILILLGLEMVLLNILASIRGSRVRFTYDGLSIFLVLLMLFVSSGLVVLESTGILGLAQRSLHISQRYVQGEGITYPLDASLETLVLSVAEGKTNLRPYDGNEILISVVYDGYFASREEASKYAQEQLIRSQRLGDNLLVEVYPPSRTVMPNTEVKQEVTILVPEALALEFNQGRGEVEITMGDLLSNWTINGDSQDLKVVLDGVSDTRIKVEIADNGRLRGNVEWDVEQEVLLLPPKDNPRKKEAREPSPCFLF